MSHMIVIVKPTIQYSYYTMNLNLNKTCVIHTQKYGTVNVEVFGQYIFLRISRRVVDARKYNVSEKLNHYCASRNNC